MLGYHMLEFSEIDVFGTELSVSSIDYFSG
jgi:hypothetical protein